MIFYKYLYFSDGVKENAKKIVQKLQQNAGMMHTHVITLSSNKEDLFDICHSALLMQKYYKDNPPFIVGIAASHEDAMELVAYIVNDIFLQSGSYEKMRQFILGRQNEVG